MNDDLVYVDGAAYYRQPDGSLVPRDTRSDVREVPETTTAPAPEEPHEPEEPAYLRGPDGQTATHSVTVAGDKGEPKTVFGKLTVRGDGALVFLPNPPPGNQS